ncbi:aftiphilin-like [Narcine bancroftii]|uniref:aftiphilin-like n=1 Tax=Narcine bancroftii TaxID=1343680 RepID=UPI003831570B
MEPDVIRMYSSSPPPLDDGAEFDEDEFGEFGGFSGVGTSTLGYNDFDLEDSHKNFMPQNHFVPGHKYSGDTHGFADFHSVGECESKDFLSDFSKPMSNSIAFKTDKDTTPSKSSRNVFECAATDSIEQTEVTTLPAVLTKNVIAIDLKQEEQEECYDNSKSNPDVLTNGFSTIDSIYPQEIENVVDTNDQKVINVHISELCSDVKYGPIEDLASENAVEMFVNLTEEETSDCLPTIGQIPLITEHNSGNHSALGKLPTGQLSLDLAIKSDELKIEQEQTKDVSTISYCKNEEGTNAIDCTQSHSSEFSSSVNTIIRNDIQNSSESMKHIETWDQNIWQATCESLDSEKETATSVTHSEVSPSENKTQSDLEKCSYHEETLGVFTHSIVCNELVVGQGKDIEKHLATKIERTDGNESDHFGISSKCSLDDFSTFRPVLPASITEDINSVQSVDSDSKNVLEFTTEEFTRFQEAGVENDFDGFDTRSNDCVATVANYPTDHAEKTVPSEIANNFKADLGFEHEATATISKTDFGEFGSTEAKNESEFSGFNSNENFSADGQDAEWNAFGDSVSESVSWAAFGAEELDECKEEISQCSRTEPALSSDTPLTSKVDSTSLQSIDEMTRINSASPCEVTMAQGLLLNRLDRIFQTCFPPVPVLEANEEASSLRQLLQSEFGKREQIQANSGELLAVWTELQDVEDAHGLRYQWGGSHSNKKLLISLGIDTRNILFTGQRKQPVIVPAYASGLGMLEPTKEPVKPISAAEKIASIGQTPTGSISASEMSSSACDQTQDHVPPVQFDWSSSGLTNPLDGVDPELYELTTSKLEGSNTVNQMTDAFARLMSTAEKMSTSSRKPKKEEILSNEAAQVIASLPDLSFMHAKVLMFPTTLTPLVTSCEKTD